MAAPFFHPIRPAALLAALALVLPACVSTARHQRAVDEAAKLRRENTELREELTRERVLRQEAVEAMSRASGGTQRAAPVPVPPRAGDAASGPAWPSAAGAPAATPAGAAQAGSIQVEDLEGSPEASLAGVEGDEGVLRVARHYRDRGRAREALEAYTRLIKDYPFSPLLAGAFMERGLVRESQGDLDGARSDFETVSQAFPDSPEAPVARRKLSSPRN